MASRDGKDLHPELRKRCDWMFDEWQRRYPGDPKPFLTATYRSATEQAELVRQGRSKAPPGRSLHNFRPALAFDVAFLEGDAVTWEFRWYQRWGELAEEAGLEWGGRWPQLVDGPHVQWPVTWQDANAGKLPDLPPVPATENPLLPVTVLKLVQTDGIVLHYALNLERPARVVGTTLWANLR